MCSPRGNHTLKSMLIKLSSSNRFSVLRCQPLILITGTGPIWTNDNSRKTASSSYAGHLKTELMWDEESARNLPTGEGLRMLIGNTWLKLDDVGPYFAQVAFRSPPPPLLYLCDRLIPLAMTTLSFCASEDTDKQDLRGF